MRKLLKNNRGDTIVEVLIAITVISLVLVGAYETSNASFLNIKDAQERVQALNFAQNQIEDLRATASQIFVGANYTNYISNAQAFCFSPSTGSVSSYTVSNCQESSSQYPQDYTSEVKLSGGPGSCSSTSTVCTFLIEELWNGINANAASTPTFNENVQLYYQINP